MKIVVRSYGRAASILLRTLKFLAAQRDVSTVDSLHVVVHESEREAYAKALGGYPYAGLIVKTQKGGHNSIRAAVEHFPHGTPILFLDDDIERVLHSETPLGKRVPMECLGAYAQDAFDTAKRVGCSLWSISESRNQMWVAEKPWKEFRPCPIPGQFWGGFNSPDLITEIAHEDDSVRACRFFAREGGGLTYNWAHFESKAENTGGMQSSGDRVSDKEEMRVLVQHLFDTIPEYRTFRKGPVWIPAHNNWGSRLRSIRVAQSVKPFTHWRWSTYFQKEPDAAPPTDLDSLL